MVQSAGILDSRASFPLHLWTVAEDITQTGCYSKGLCLPEPFQLFTDLLFNSRLAYPTIALTSPFQRLIGISDNTFQTGLLVLTSQTCSFCRKKKKGSLGMGWVGRGGCLLRGVVIHRPKSMPQVCSWDQGEDRIHSQTSFPGCYVLPTAAFGGENRGHGMDFPFSLDDINGTTMDQSHSHDCIVLLLGNNSTDSNVSRSAHISRNLISVASNLNHICDWALSLIRDDFGLLSDSVTGNLVILCGRKKKK